MTRALSSCAGKKKVFVAAPTLPGDSQGGEGEMTRSRGVTP